jgi:hypothetical protein
MDDVLWIILCVAVLLGFFGFGVEVGQHSGGSLLTTCEASLPRDQHCVLTAIPGRQ